MTLRRPTTSQIREAAEDLGMELSETEIETFAGMAQGALDAFDLLDLMPDYLPPVKYPRTPGYRPEGEENKYGAWYVKTSIKGREGGKLAGKKIAIKDAVCVAGVPLMDGASALEGYVPDVDATVVTRILDAGGEIAGKAVCEYFSYAGTSYTPSHRGRAQPAQIWLLRGWLFVGLCRPRRRRRGGHGDRRPTRRDRPAFPPRCVGFTA